MGHDLAKKNKGVNMLFCGAFCSFVFFALAQIEGYTTSSHYSS